MEIKTRRLHSQKSHCPNVIMRFQPAVFVMNLFLAITIIFCTNSCKKETNTLTDTNFNGFKVLEVSKPTIVPGNNNILILSDSNVVLTDNSGNSIWKMVLPIGSLRLAVAEPGGIFTIVDGADRIRITEAGVVLKRDTNFFSEVVNNVIKGIFIKPNGNYALWGQFSNNLPLNGLLCEIDSTGKKVFKTITSSNTTFSDCQIDPNGNFLLYGSHANILIGTNYRFLVTSIDTKGKILFSRFVETNEVNNQTGNILQLSTGKMLHTNDGAYIGTSNGTRYRSLLIKFSGNATLLDTLSLDKYGSFSGIPVRKSNGNFAIMMTASTRIIPGLGGIPTAKAYSTLIEFNEKLQIISTKTYDQGSFGLIGTSSEGNIIAAGTIFSFEKINKSVMIII